MAQSVDPNKVIQKLAARIGNEILQSVINEVAVEDLEAAQAAAAATPAQEVQPATSNEG